MSIQINIIKKYIEISFKSHNFWNEIKDTVYSYNSVFDGATNIWKHKICGITKNLIKELKELDEIIQYNTSEEDLLSQCNKVIGIKYIRRKYLPELLKFPPIQGKGEFKDFQIEDIKKFISTNRLINGNDLGTGKSYEISVILSHLFFYKEIDRCLIICPGHLVYDWFKKLKKFFYKEINSENCYIVDVNNREPFESGCDIVIISYRSLVMLFDDALKKQGSIIKKDKKRKKKEIKNISIQIEKWGNSRCIVADEASCIKGDSLQKICIDNIKIFFEFRYPLSGTFAPNKIEEIYHAIDFIDENIIPMSYYQFLKSIADVGNRFSKMAVNNYYPEKVENFLKKYVHPYMTCRKAKDVLVLPEFTMEDIFCKLSLEHNKLYQLLTIEILNQVKEIDNGYITIKTINNKFPYILESLSNPKLLKDKFTNNNNINHLIENFKLESNSKIEILDSLFKKHIVENNEKIIVWSFHPLTIESLSNYFKKYNPVVIHGKVGNVEVKNDLVDAFCRNESNKILIANPTCLSQGVTINEATVMINFDFDFDLEKYLQRLKRNYRVGQTKSVIVYNLIFDNTIETYVIDCLNNKKELNDFLTEKKYLNKEECLKLFTGRI